MSFTWQGISSDTMKFNIDDRQVYNAPAFDVTAYEVPGRSGDLLDTQNRFKNKDVVYTGFLRSKDFAGTTYYEKLSNGLRALKMWLLSNPGQYHDLTDDYDPGFVRKGFVFGETAIKEVGRNAFGSTIQVTFRCKPFMYAITTPVTVTTKTVSGPIASFSDGADNAPLSSLKFYIEPKQDLNGYENPWPGGSTKNLLPGFYSGLWGTANTSSWTISNYNSTPIAFPYSVAANEYQTVPAIKVPLSPNTQYYISEAPLKWWAIRFYNSSDTALGTVGANFNHGAFTTPANTAYAIIASSNYGGSATTLTTSAQMQLELGSEGTSYIPYSNICPIIGFSAIDGIGAGKNLIEGAAGYSSNNVTMTKNSDGSYSFTGTASALTDFVIQPIGSLTYLPQNTSYVLSPSGAGNPNGTSNYLYASIKKSDGTIRYAGSGASATPTATINLADGEYIQHLFIRVANGANTDGIVVYPLLQYVPATSLIYEKGIITPIPLTIPGTPGTVYGGYWDVVNGKLVVDRAKVLATDMTWTLSGTDSFYVNKTDKLRGTATAISSHFVCTTYGSSDRILLTNTGFTSKSALNTYFNEQTTAGTPIELVYKLATPIEYSVTPQQVNSLLGVNNIWCDSGDTEVGYIAEHLDNQSGFTANPLITITMTGAGNLNVNGKTWQIANYSGTLYCDTETMDWYDSAQLRNSLVTGDGFPELVPGDNIIFYSGGITGVTIDPRWRAL